MLSNLLLTSMNIIRYYKYYITVIQGINHTIPTAYEYICGSLSFRKLLWFYVFYHFSSHIFFIATLIIFIVIDIVFIIEYFLLFR